MKVHKFTLVMMLVFALIMMITPTALAQDNSSPANTITVTGTGSATGEPDMSTLIVGVEMSGEDILTVYGQVNSSILTVMTALEEIGLADEDMRTTGLDVYASPIFMGEGMVRNETRISNRINITIRDLSQIENVIDTAINNGANTVFGLQFGVADTDALQSEARINALTDARKRAEEIATNLGVDLGAVVTVREFNNGGGFFDVGANAMMNMGGGGAVIEPGQISVSMSIEVTFAFDS